MEGVVIDYNYEDMVCLHCGHSVAIRNPSEICDHLYYPECCSVCKEKAKNGQPLYNDHKYEIEEEFIEEKDMVI